MRSARTGLTLLEVLAAIGLLATLLSAVVVAGARHTRQVRAAQDRLVAQEIADRLLAKWLLEGQGQIEALRGEVTGRTGWEWRVSGRTEEGLELLGVHVGRLTILKQDRAAGATETEEKLAVLATVEFVSSAAVTAEAAARGTR